MKLFTLIYNESIYTQRKNSVTDMDIIPESFIELNNVSDDFIKKLLVNSNSIQQRIKDRNTRTDVESRMHEDWLVEELMLETRYARLKITTNSEENRI